MEKLVIVHPSLNFCGGAERQTLNLLSFISKICDNVELFTIDLPNEEKIKEKLGLSIPENIEIKTVTNEVIFPNANIKKMLHSFIKYYYNLRQLKNNSYKIFLMQGEFDLLHKYADIIYFQAVPFSFCFKIKNITPIYLSNPLFKIVYLLWKNSFSKNYYKVKLCICNSNFLAKILNLKKYYIIYPIAKIDVKICKKENIICSIGRFTVNKQIHRIFYISKIAEKYNYELIIAGKVENQKYLHYIEKIVNTHHLKNIQILKNPSFETISKIYSISKICINTMDYESFGLTVLESIFNFNVPVVSKLSGAWTDIIKEKNFIFGCGYSSVFDLKNIIYKLLSDENIQEKIRKNLNLIINEFSYLKLKRKAIETLQKILF